MTDNCVKCIYCEEHLADPKVPFRRRYYCRFYREFLSVLVPCEFWKERSLGGNG